MNNVKYNILYGHCINFIYYFSYYEYVNNLFFFSIETISKNKNCSSNNHNKYVRNNRSICLQRVEKKI